jgi:hypothetical protein
MKAPEYNGGFFFPLVGFVNNHDCFTTKQSIISIPLTWSYHRPIADISIV